jgi:hypothetical protein
VYAGITSRDVGDSLEWRGGANGESHTHRLSRRV